MGVNRVVINNEVKLDLTADTVTPDTLLSGVTAHNAAGNLIVGEAEPPSYFYTGTGTPAASFGSVGDFFFVTG